MSKPIVTYPEQERLQVVLRRLKQRSGGLGYLAAVDAARHYLANTEAITLVQQPPEEEE